MTGFGSITVANAPVSYGAFELTVGIDPSTPDGLHVLDEVASAGYAGIDLGPVGYLGSGDELADRLASRGLGLAGAYLELPYTDAEALEKVLPELDAMLDTFNAVARRRPRRGVARVRAADQPPASQEREPGRRGGHRRRRRPGRGRLVTGGVPPARGGRPRRRRLPRRPAGDRVVGVAGGGAGHPADDV